MPGGRELTSMRVTREFPGHRGLTPRPMIPIRLLIASMLLACVKEEKEVCLWTFVRPRSEGLRQTTEIML